LLGSDLPQQHLGLVNAPHIQRRPAQDFRLREGLGRYRIGRCARVAAAIVHTPPCGSAP
jgi:hypothetical protein